MKKILIFTGVIIFTLVILPLIGNRVVENALNTKIENLKANGVAVKNTTTESSYFMTKRHYEFFVQDLDKFVDFLSTYSGEELPYVNDAIDGVVIGSDLEYSNFPFTKAVSIDIYPMNIPKSIKKSLKKENLDFSNFIEEFLKNRGLLYHINYNIVSEDFDGYLKDIKEEYTLKDSTKVFFELSNAVYYGNGKLIAPDLLVSNISAISLRASKKDKGVDIKLENFSSNTNFESLSSYVSSAKLKSLQVKTKSLDNNITFDLSKLYTNISSDTKGVKAEAIIKSSVENFMLESQEVNFKFSNFNYEASFNEMDKDAYEAFYIALDEMKNKNSKSAQDKVEESIVSLLSKGLKFKISDFSISDVSLQDKQSLGGFLATSTLNLRKDPSLNQKINNAPFLIAENVNSDTKITINKQLFIKLADYLPIIAMVQSYAKEEADNYVYEIIYQDQGLKINGKAL